MNHKNSNNFLETIMNCGNFSKKRDIKRKINNK